MDANLDADLEAREDWDAAIAVATFFVVVADSSVFFLVDGFPAGTDFAVVRDFPMVTAIREKLEKEE